LDSLDRHGLLALADESSVHSQTTAGAGEREVIEQEQRQHHRGNHTDDDGRNDNDSDERRRLRDLLGELTDALAKHVAE